MSRDCKLIFVGDSKKRSYLGSGIDDKKDYQINCQVNDEIMVTKEKKVEMLKDHGNWFKDPDVVKVEPVKEQPAPEATIEPEPEQMKPSPLPDDYYDKPDYESMTNAELRTRAGTDDKRLSKKKLIKLIESKK